MTEFFVYLKLGFQHITDLNGFDHILFLLALCAIFSLESWRKVIILVTAFTVGHSLTLALAVLEVFPVNTSLVELIIPITILITCLFNFAYKFPKSLTGIRQRDNQKNRYLLAVIFGLIHGLGFSSYLKSLLGSENSILTPLFSFNVGLELGQLLIVFFALIINMVLTEFFKVRKKSWNHILSGIVFGMALMMVFDRI